MKRFSVGISKGRGGGNDWNCCENGLGPSGRIWLPEKRGGRPAEKGWNGDRIIGGGGTLKARCSSSKALFKSKGGGVRPSGRGGLIVLDKTIGLCIILPAFIIKGIGPMTDMELIGPIDPNGLILIGGRMPNGEMGLDWMRSSSRSCSASSLEQMMEMRSPETTGIKGTAVAFLAVMGNTLIKSSAPSIGRRSTTHLLLSSGFRFINI